MTPGLENAAVESYARRHSATQHLHERKITVPSCDQVVTPGDCILIVQHETSLEGSEQSFDRALCKAMLELVPLWDGMTESF